jgi:small subunit ribosomal protein S18
MKRTKRKDLKKKGSGFAKLSLFQKPGIKFFKACPLSGKEAPVVDYKNLKILKKYLSESGRILPSRITSVCLKKQKELARAVKRARLLALL